MLDVKLLHNKEIDLVKWDKVIGNSPNSRVYAFSWFLNILNPDWHGLIVGDYEYVMPAMVSSKFGIKYLYQPIYAQQLGIFPPADEEITNNIFCFLQQKYRYIDISLNSSNAVELEDVHTEYRKNFLLPLNTEYQAIFKNYTNGCKNNLKKAIKLNHVFSNISPDDFFHFITSGKQLKVVKKTLPTLVRIINAALQNGSGLTYGAYSENGRLTAVALFLNDGKRSTYLFSSSSKTGKKNNSMFSILDTFIREHAGQNLTLDFEGSIIPGIAYFFGGFGASPEIYQHIKYNHLPFFIKYFKK